MPQREFISRFSPNRTDPEILEKILVQRQDLLEQSVAALRESALTRNKHHLLFIGPRGCGKTHLLALIVHRLQQQADLADRLRIAWLNEDETSISFLDLLLRIYRTLSDRYPDEFPREGLKKLYGQDREEAQSALTQDLIKRIGKRTLLVLVENLDTLFDQLEDSEQRTWRAFIQNHPVFATAATAQSLFAGVSQREQPFFGFFDTRHLRPLTVEEATELLQRIARLNGDSKLTEFLSTPRGRARVRAIHHLSGGNPRLYIVLSDFITRDSLDELVRPLEEMVDEQLTPYYQERLRWLSPLQRKIVEFLCFRPGPVPVKVIADRLFAEHGTITSQLKKLREMCYVLPNPRGRESLYELAEPLMRLSMQVKDTRDHQPLDLIIDFLRVWYDREDLEQRLARIASATPSWEYLSAALAKLQSDEPDLRHQLLRQGLEHVDLKCCDADQIDELKALAEESGQAGDWLNCATACHHAKRWLEAVEAFEKVPRCPDVTPTQVASASEGRRLALSKAGRAEQVISELTQCIECAGASAKDVTQALVNRAIAFAQTGRTEEAVKDYTRIIELAGAPIVQVAWALVKRGLAFGVAGRFAEAVSDFTQAIELPRAPIEQVAWALANRGAVFAQTGRLEEATADNTRVIELPGAPAGPVACALVNRGAALTKVGRTKEAVIDFTRTIELPGAVGAPVAWALVNRGAILHQSGLADQAMAEFTRAIDVPNAPVEQVARALVYRGIDLSQAGRNEEAIADYTRAIGLPGARVAEVAQALVNRGAALGQIGHYEEAVADLTRVIEMPGAPAESVAQALLNRGVAFHQAGRTDEAIIHFKRAIEFPDAPPHLVSWARGCLAGASFDADAWKEGIEQLYSVFGNPAIPWYPTATFSATAIRAIFRQFGSPETWRARLVEAVSIYRQYNALAELGHALIRHLADLAKSPLNNAGLDQWLAAWEQATSQDEAMRLPLRLLRVGIAYLKTKPRDETVLLELPKEERLLVREALGLPTEQVE